MKFSIITPTYKRRNKLERAVKSLINQTYKDWEMIIINDSPFDKSYDDFVTSFNDKRIIYHKNEINEGVNYSRNKGLDLISADSKWVIFLDDDDYFAPDTLANFNKLILLHPNKKWFVTNRALQNGKSLTNFPKDETGYSYAWQYLILKRCKGDATHCIETKTIINNKITFSKYVKQGEEWFFFYQLGLISKMYYESHNSTISEGYDTSSGLNFRKRTRRERFESVIKIIYEANLKKISKHINFIFYIILKLLQNIIKK